MSDDLSAKEQAVLQFMRDAEAAGKPRPGRGLIARGLAEKGVQIPEATIQNYLQKLIRLGYVSNRVRNESYDYKDIPVADVPNDSPTLADQLLSSLRRTKDTAHDIEALADRFDCAPRAIREAIAHLQNTGHLLHNTADDKIAFSSVVPLKEPIPVSSTGDIRFGALSDLHLGNKHERLDALNSVYQWYKNEGIDTVYLAGNMIEGEARFNLMDRYVTGMDAQIDNAIEKLPQVDGITTRFVAGDDHEGWYQQREGIEIGRHIEDCFKRAGRDDLEYLGYGEADIQFQNGGGSFMMRVVHPGGGSAYAFSYKPQKYVEALQGGEKPAVVLMGHYHKLEYLPSCRGVRVWQTGTLCDQTTFLRKNNIPCHIGAWSIELVQCPDTGACIGAKQEDRTFFDKGFYQKYGVNA